jgi:hypothetical protein
MIKEGSRIILRTDDAIYSPCRVLSLSKVSITVTYFAGSKRNKQTGAFQEIHPVETISLNKVISMSERL